MVTDRYQHVFHHPTVDDLVTFAAEHGLEIVGIDNVAGSVPIESSPLPNAAIMVFGQEGPGLSPEMISAATGLYAITQYGSTRSLNAGVASGIAMYAWVSQHHSTTRPQS